MEIKYLRATAEEVSPEDFQAMKGHYLYASNRLIRIIELFDERIFLDQFIRIYC